MGNGLNYFFTCTTWRPIQKNLDTVEVGVWVVKKCVKFSNFLLFYLKALKTVVKLVFNLFQNIRIFTVMSLTKIDHYMIVIKYLKDM